MNKPFYLFCKSYIGDLDRVARLWSSIERFNVDEIPFYLCVPFSDLVEFKNRLGVHSDRIVFLTDEEIIKKNPRLNLGDYANWPGYLAQQVVKSEFWRFFDVQDVTYLCIDSESVFIKDFYTDDFVSGSAPYTVLHQNKELLQLASNRRIEKVVRNFHKTCSKAKLIFGRVGPDYDYGPTPVVWSSKVWQDLDSKYLIPNGITIWDAILQFPSELSWYGEALIFYKSVPLQPVEPFFRVYHYDWQYLRMKKLGETECTVRSQYMGILMQSNWDYSTDYGVQANRKSYLSKLLKSIKRFLAGYR
jgi:hypothetical protein